jgi:hypothetical protein
MRRAEDTGARDDRARQREQVIEATGAVVSRIAREAPSLSIVVTSQVPLRIGAERSYRIGPLALPPSVCSAQEALATVP